MFDLSSLRDRADREFTSALASAMLQENIIDERIADTARLGINALSLSSPYESPLSTLKENCPDFYYISEAYLGELGLFGNLFRLQLQHSVKMLNNCLEDQGDRILQRAELFFNRPFYFYRKGIANSQGLFSSVLVDLSDSIWQQMRQLDIASAQLRNIVFVDSDSDGSKLTQSLAKHIQQCEESKFSVPFRAENSAIREVGNIGENIGALLGNYSEIILENLAPDQSNTKAGLIGAEINAISSGLKNINFKICQDLKDWEQQAQSCLLLIERMVVKLVDLFDETTVHLTAKNLSFPQFATQAIYRVLTQKLLSSGHAPLEARQAAQKMADYCERNNLPLSDLTLVEASKINPSISEDILTWMIEKDGDSRMSHNRTEEKSAALVKFESLKNNFRPVND